MDIVLNSLSGELTDASLRLLPYGGTFLEMGKTDLREVGAIARKYPGVTYWPFETAEAGPARLGQILRQVVGLLTAGELAMLPVTAWDVRRAREAFRFMSQARHTGKLVLTIPPDAAARRSVETVLVTEGTEAFGGQVARYLAGAGGPRHLVLASGPGPGAVGASALAAGLAEAGAAVQVVACDVTDRPALAGLLTRVPVTEVVHAPGTGDDGGDGVAAMRRAVDGAWSVHELTLDKDLDALVLMSRGASTGGFHDGLSTCRRAAGWPAVSVVWGPAMSWRQDRA